MSCWNLQCHRRCEELLVQGRFGGWEEGFDWEGCSNENRMDNSKKDKITSLET